MEASECGWGREVMGTVRAEVEQSREEKTGGVHDARQQNPEPGQGEKGILVDGEVVYC